VGDSSTTPAKCAACHPTGSASGCGIVKKHTSGDCMTCHGDSAQVSEVCTTGGCPAAAVLGDEDPQLAKLRVFRDKVLAKSALGRAIIASYYNNADSINAALANSPALKAFSSKALKAFIPVAEIFM
jgi:hypothetical protein